MGSETDKSPKSLGGAKPPPGQYAQATKAAQTQHMKVAFLENLPKNHKLTQDPYYNYYYRKPKYLFFGYRDPLGYLFLFQANSISLGLPPICCIKFSACESDARQPTIMENQMEKKMENEMETGMI